MAPGLEDFTARHARYLFNYRIISSLFSGQRLCIKREKSAALFLSGIQANGTDSQLFLAVGRQREVFHKTRD